MAMFFKKLVSSSAFVVALCLAPAAFGGDAQNLVQAKHAEMMTMLKKAPSAERDRQVATVLSSLFDYDNIAEQSMGKHWASLTGEQKTEFKGLLKQLVQRNLEKSVKTTVNYDVQFLGEEAANGGTQVKTKAVSKTNAREEPVAIDYTLRQNNGTWRAVDVNTEGSSMVGNYRSQFNRIMTKDGYPTLIKKMKDKLAQGGALPSFAFETDRCTLR